MLVDEENALVPIRRSARPPFSNLPTKVVPQGHGQATTQCLLMVHFDVRDAAMSYLKLEDERTQRKHRNSVALDLQETLPTYLPIRAVRAFLYNGYARFRLPPCGVARNSLVMADRDGTCSRQPCSISRLRRRNVFTGRSSQCRRNTGGIQTRDPYVMNATLLRMARPRKTRISLVKNVRSTIAEARYPAKSVIVMAQNPYSVVAAAQRRIRSGMSGNYW